MQSIKQEHLPAIKLHYPDLPKEYEFIRGKNLADLIKLLHDHQSNKNKRNYDRSVRNTYYGHVKAIKKAILILFNVPNQAEPQSTLDEISYYKTLSYSNFDVYKKLPPIDTLRCECCHVPVFEDKKYMPYFPTQKTIWNKLPSTEVNKLVKKFEEAILQVKQDGL